MRVAKRKYAYRERDIMGSLKKFFRAASQQAPQNQSTFNKQAAAQLLQQEMQKEAQRQEIRKLFSKLAEAAIEEAGLSKAAQKGSSPEDLQRLIASLLQ